MPGLTSADPNTHSTLNISWVNGQQRNSGIISPPRNMSLSCRPDHFRFDHQNSVDCKELPHFDPRKAEENLSLYCKPIQLYNIIQRRNLKNPIFLHRCLSYKIQAARKMCTKLKISVVNVSITPSDVALSTGKVKGWCQETNPVDFSFQPVLVMLTTPISTPGMGYSCFRLGQMRVLRPTVANISRSDDKGQSSVTFLLPEVQKMLKCSERDGTTFVFISSVSNNASVLWGSLSLTAICKHWLGTCTDHDSDKELAPALPALTIQVDLHPTRLQLINTAEVRYLKFQSRPVAHDGKCVAKLQLYISRDNLDGIIDDFNCAIGSEKVLKYSSPLHGWWLQPGQVVFHYHYYFNSLYKSEVTEDYSCPFCMRHCSSLKGLRCHLNSSHDLFTFEFIATTGYRIVNVFCRNGVLGPEGNIHDFDGINRLCLKHFIYWSKYRRHCKLLTSVDNIERWTEGDSALYESMSSAQNLSSTGMQTAQNLGEFQVQQVLQSNMPKSVYYSSTLWNGKYGESKDNILRTKKRERKDLKMMQITEDTSQLKKQRSGGFTGSDSLAYGASAHDRFGSGSNGVCLAIAAPLITDKSRLQQTIKTPVLHSRSFMDKHHKALAERCEARIRSQLMKRDLFHSHTSQPMTLEQLLSDRDSEDEHDDQVIDFEDRQMLSRFVDVAQHEKDLMHLWNSFVRKQRVLADGHCSWGCEAFSKLHAMKFNNNPSLRRCLVLFLTKLWNHNLVDGSTIDRCLFIIDSSVETMKTERNA